MTKRYGGRGDFLQTFHPVYQEKYTRDIDRCYFGTAPTLSKVNKDYGKGTAEEWLVYQLADLSEFSGARDKLTRGQIQQAARLIAHEYGWLTVSELMLFFRNFKMAKYGRFYGSVDPMIILSVLHDDFLPDRWHAYEMHEQEQREREQEKNRQNRISYDEYLAMKERGELKNL